MDYLIKVEACTEIDGSQSTRLLRVSEPLSKNPPEHSWLESRNNYGMITNQGKVRTNRETPPCPEVADYPGPNNNLRTIVQPTPPRQPPMYWHIEILYRHPRNTGGLK